MTKKEHDFLKELSSLLEKYNELFLVDKQGRLSLQVYEDLDFKTNWEQIAIYVEESFDESDINDLLVAKLKSPLDTTTL